MSGSLNEVSLMGNLGADPEIRTLNSGDRVATLSLATSESWKDRTTGEKKEKTEWHRVVVFNDNLAKVAGDYLKKGSKVLIKGKLQTRKWQDERGTDRWTTEIVVTTFDGKLILLGDSQAGNRPPPADSADDYGTTKTRDTAERRTYDLDDEIPF